MPVESVFFGNILAAPYSELVRQFKEWFGYEQLTDEQKGYIPLFRFDGRYSLLVDEGGTKKTKRGKLFEFTSKDVLENLLTRIEKEYKARNLLYVGGDDAFTVDPKEKKSRYIAHVGDVVLDGHVKTKTHGGLKQKSAFERVIVHGPFEDSSTIFDELYGQSEDFAEAMKKQGFSHVRLMDTNIAALLYYAKKHPQKVKGFNLLKGRRAGLTFFVPFYSDRARTAEMAVPHITTGKQPPLSLLKWSVMMDYFFNGNNFYSIGKKLNRLEPLFNPITINKIVDGAAGFEVLAHSYPFSQEHMRDYSRPVQEIVVSMLSALERKGFKLNGYSIEKKFSDYEVGTIEFTKGSENIRFLFSPEYPPVYVKRESAKKPVDIFRPIDPATHKHPFEELFEPKIVYDDKTRTETPYEVIVPTQFRIPQEMWDDYRRAINFHFPGGAEALRTRVHERDIPEKSRIIQMLKS